LIDYYDLYDVQFELLVVALCQKLLGEACQGFSAGPDGGRDAKFVGTANLLPSEAEPWKGTTIVQAKHTLATNASFSDSDCSGSFGQSTVLGGELPKIAKLKASGALDHYLLFSNRKLSAQKNEIIVKKIHETCQIPIGSILICGVEKLDMWLRSHREVVELVDLDPMNTPLAVDPRDLADVVEALSEQFNDIEVVIRDSPVRRTSYSEKNALNGLSKDYATYFRKKNLKYSADIENFLANPENVDIRAKYMDAVDEFERNVLAKRREFVSFEQVLNYLLTFLFSRDAMLRKNKALTNAIIFHMYFNCDLGRSKDDIADEAHES
jgi:hypothetical protein